MTIEPFCIIGAHVSLVPGLAYHQEEDEEEAHSSIHLPLRIGAFSTIGKDCTLSCAHIGRYVTIEEGCMLGDRVILHDYVRVLKHTFIPPNTVIPPFAIVSPDSFDKHILFLTLRL
mgnify:CR=1 FL=1